ncbi:MAG: hypothetical protein V3U03_08150 [Myxococcota bacterium]
MTGLSALAASESIRVRRWDALVLGGALPGRIAAVQLASRGAHVLLVEEKAAAEAFPGLRDPFLVHGADPGGVLGACLEALGIPLLERRSVATYPVAYQVALPDARVEVAAPPRTAEELVAWGFAVPEEAGAVVRAIGEAGAAERDAMLEAPVVRSAQRLPRAARPTASSAAARPAPLGTRRARRARGLPVAVTSAAPALATLLAAQLRALSNLGESAPPPEASARLLGAALEGATVFPGGAGALSLLLRRRLEALHGELRSVSGTLRLVSAANQPGILVEESGEVWVGRALVLNAPRQALAAVAGDPVPEVLRGPPVTRIRLAVRYVARRGVLPEGMAPRVICVRDPDAGMDGTNLVTLRVFPRPEGGDQVDLVASAVVGADERDLDARRAEIGAAVAQLMPFSADGLVLQRHPEPRWDSGAPLSDPPPGEGWPAAVELRVSTRPPVYVLERAGMAALGFEGDVLLGWRAGDAIAADLS